MEIFSKIYSMNVDCEKITWTCNQLCIHYKNIRMKNVEKILSMENCSLLKDGSWKITTRDAIKIICRMLPIFCSKDLAKNMHIQNGWQPLVSNINIHFDMINKSCSTIFEIK